MISRPSKSFYEFDSFRIDIGERRLLCRDTPVPLTPKVFDVLLTLVENSGHTLAKNDLMDRIWADTFVDEGNLSRSVSTLRRALGEDAHGQHYIKTVPKRGYRFEGDVREVVEEDESITVERRTDYRLAVRETTETRSETRLTPVTLVAVAFAAILIAAFTLTWLQPRTNAVAVTAAASSDEMSTLQSRLGTDNAVARHLYTEGRELWRNRSVGGLHNATLKLEQAIALDPEFALAHAALADAYAFDVIRWRQAEAAAREAIRLDPNLGEPHATLGFIKTFWEWKLLDADAHFRRALTLNPDYATGHQWYAISLTARAQGGGGVASMRRALELEPQSVAINADMCQMLYFARKYDEAVGQCRRTLEIDAQFIPAHHLLYQIYTATGQYADAVDAFFAAERLSTTSAYLPSQLDEMRTAFERGGIRSFWRKQIEILEGRKEPGAYGLGLYYSLLGNRDQALEWFARSAERREFDFVYFLADPAHQRLDTDDRYQRLAAIFLNQAEPPQCRSPRVSEGDAFHIRSDAVAEPR